MDPLAISAATLVAKWAAEGFVKEAAGSAWSGLQRVYHVVRRRLSGDQAGAEALEQLERTPASEGRKQVLAEILDALLNTSSDFADELRCVLDEIERDSSSTAKSFVIDVRDNAKVGKIVSIGTVKGNVNVSD